MAEDRHLKTSSEVELMETLPGCLDSVLTPALKTSSEVELMEMSRRKPNSCGFVRLKTSSEVELMEKAWSGTALRSILEDSKLLRKLN